MDDAKKFIEEGKIGEVPWDNPPKKVIDWRKCRIRIIGEFQEFFIHWINTNERWHMEKCSHDSNCEFCKQGKRATSRYNVVALDKEDNTVKRVEIGAQVYSQIFQYIRNGYRLENCDFIIRKDSSQKTPFYKVDVVDSMLNVEEQLAVDEYKHEEIPISLLVLDTDICPKHRIKGEIANGICKCPNCGYIIWGN